MNAMRYVQPASIALCLLAATYGVTLVILHLSDTQSSWVEFFGPGSWQVPVALGGTIVLAASPALVAWLVYLGRRTWWSIVILGVSFFVVSSLLTVLACAATLVWLVAPEVEPVA